MANKLRGLPRIRGALINSAAGFRDMWRNEEAFRIEVVLCVLAVPLALWLGRGGAGTALLLATALVPLIVEALNSAIEAAVDRIGPERHELSRMAKDMGSLSVAIACLVPLLVWAGALWDRLA